jgi:hypothetical protein
MNAFAWESLFHTSNSSGATALRPPGEIEANRAQLLATVSLSIGRAIRFCGMCSALVRTRTLSLRLTPVTRTSGSTRPWPTSSAASCRICRLRSATKLMPSATISSTFTASVASRSPSSRMSTPPSSSLRFSGRPFCACHCCSLSLC